MYSVNRFDFSPVDVAANHAVCLMAARHGDQRLFVFRNKLHGRLGLELQKRRQRPVTETQRAPQAVEIQVKVENPVVKMRSKFFEQVVKMCQAVCLMTVDDEILFPVGSGMHDLPGHGHAAKSHAYKLLDKFVMVAGNVNDPGLLAAFAKQFLNEHIVVVAPEPTELEFPSVNEIADQIKVFAIHLAQEFQQFGNTGMPRAEVDVRNPNRAAAERLVQIQFQGLLFIVVHNL